MRYLSKLLLATVLFLFFQNSNSQQLINGDFENNSVTVDQINLANITFNSYMENCSAFGSFGNVDIITSATWGSSGAQNGDWYIGLTGGGTDQVSMELDEQLQSGNSYTVSFWDRKDPTYNCYALQVGVSNDLNDFGEVVYTSPEVPTNNVWTEREFTFTSPINALYLTVQQSAGLSSDWVNVDNFQVLCDLDLNLGADTTTCLGNTVFLDAFTEDAISYEWQDGSTESSYEVTESGIYSVNLQSETCNISDFIVITMLPFPEIELEESVTTCWDEEVVLSASSDFILADFYWSTGDSSTSTIADEAGFYTVEVTSGGLCFSVDSIEVIHVDYPVLNLDDYLLICENQSEILVAGPEDLNYVWQDGSTNNSYLVEQEGIYSVSADNGYCTSEDEILVETEVCEFLLEMPNIFTPNNDDLNDFWVPLVSENVFNIKLEVYNRWGNLIYDYDGEELKWEGKDAPAGTYYYILTYRNQYTEEKTITGYVMLVRE